MTCMRIDSSPELRSIPQFASMLWHVKIEKILRYGTAQNCGMILSHVYCNSVMCEDYILACKFTYRPVKVQQTASTI